MTPRRLGPGAAPLSAARAPGARPGRPRPCRRRRWPPDWSRPGRPGRPPPGASGRPGAGQITALRPPARTYSVASSCQQALGAGQVEPAPRRPRSLGRFGPGHPLLTEDPGQPRRRGRLEAHGGHLVVHADRTVVQSRAPPEPRAHRGPGREPDRAGIADGATGARPPPRAPPPGARRRKTQERLAPDALLGAERRHRPAGRVIGPSGDRQTDTGINTAVLIGAHPSIPNHECHHQDPPNRHRCPDTELSPMS